MSISVAKRNKIFRGKKDERITFCSFYFFFIQIKKIISGGGRKTSFRLLAAAAPHNPRGNSKKKIEKSKNVCSDALNCTKLQRITFIMPKYTFKLSVVVLFHLDYFQKTFYNIEPCSNPLNASSIITQIFGGYFLPYPSFRRLLIRFFSVIFRFLEDTLGCGNRFFRFAFVANDLGKDVGHGLGRLVTFRVALDVAASDTSHQTVQSRQDVLARTLLSRHGLRRHRSAERGSRFT